MQSGQHLRLMTTGMIEVNLRQPVSSFSYGKVHNPRESYLKAAMYIFFFRKLVYMRSVTSETAFRAF